MGMLITFDQRLNVRRGNRHHLHLTSTDTFASDLFHAHNIDTTADLIRKVQTLEIVPVIVGRARYTYPKQHLSARLKPETLYK